MIKQIKNTLQFYSAGLRWGLAAIMIGGAAGTGLVFLITGLGSSEGEQTYIMLGSFMAYLIFLIIAIFSGESFCCGQFNMMVSMGRTRKEFYVSCYLVLFIHAIVDFLAVLLISLLERGIYNRIYKEWRCEMEFGSILLDYRMILCTVLLVPVCGMFLGALFMRFHMKVVWVIWGLIFFFNIAVRTEGAARCMETIADVWSMTGPVIQIAGVAILTAVLTAGSALLYSRQAVNG